MRVALVDVNYGSSSTGKIVADLVAGLSDRGHHAKAFFGRGGGGSAVSTRISSRGEVMFHALATRLSGWTDGFSPLATHRLIARLEQLQPDVVHLHDLHGYFIDILDLCAYLKRNDIATVWTFHSEFMYTGRCGLALDCDGWKTGCGHCPDLARYPKTWFFDFSAQMHEQKRLLFADFRSLHLAAPSKWLASRMRESMVGDKPIAVVPNGLDTRIFRPRDASALAVELGLEGRYCVLAVGADLLSPLKGGRWVLELAQRFAREDLVFLMVGVDSVPATLPANVVMQPRVTDQERLAQIYALGDVLMLPSERETFSMVTAEALACGLPVIGFDSGGPKEVAPPGYGSFVPYGDLDALETLLRASRCGRAGLRSAADCTALAQTSYSREAMVLAYEAIYQQLRTHE